MNQETHLITKEQQNIHKKILAVSIIFMCFLAACEPEVTTIDGIYKNMVSV